jgi:FkbM family methyltransferase
MFISYAQNREDVVLWRALRSITDGRYVEIGANDPVDDSITKAFYDRGWSGLEVEPEPDFARRYREARPRDVVVEAAVTPHGDSIVLHRIAGTGLSTTVDEIGTGHEEAGFSTEELTVRGTRLDALLAETGFDRGDVHFCVIDVEGAEADVLSTVDLRAWRPWVLVIEATEPNATRSTRDQWEEEVLAAGYQFCLFDGVSCFYVADEHAATLAKQLSYSAAVTDRYEDARHQRTVADLTERLGQAMTDLADSEAGVQEWRTKALVTWASGIVSAADLDARVGHIGVLTDQLAKAERRNVRQAAQIKALRRRLRQVPAAPEPGSSVGLARKVARKISGRGR